MLRWRFCYRDQTASREVTVIHVPAKGSIAVLDDDEFDRTIITTVIERSHLENNVITFATGEDLLAHLDDVTERTASCPTLVLLDVNMPGMTGFEVLAAIRSRHEFTEIPVVAMLTSSDAEADKTKARQLGANGYLAKQSGLAAFVDTVNQHFTNN